ncbi:MAG: phage major capsid protein [Gammaproteobacteria bacterium]|nr:phage major capsid protein [Gammaproteobacteria bacterium]
MRLLIKDSPLMRLATVVPMQSPKQQLSKIKFGSRVLRPGAEATALPLADRARPDLSQVELDAKLFKAEVRLSDEVLEDSIERGELRQTIMEMMAEAISRDMEEVLINGDTLSADPFLAVMDGALKQATSNVVDAGGAAISKNLLRDMLKTIPSEHLRDKKAMRFMTSVDADLDYRNTLAERATAVGDRLLEGDTPVPYSGVPLQPIPLFPENLGAGSDQTVILLCNPKNIHVGIWRNIRVESARDISEGTLKIVATLRFDVKFAEEPGVAKAINVQL